MARFLRTDAPVTAISAGSAANTVVTGHANGNIVIWVPERREPLTGNASGNGSAVRAIAVNAETMRAATGTDDGLVREWDLGTGSPLGDAIAYLSPHDGAPVGVASLAYAADGLVVVGRDSTMRRYSATGETVAAEVMQERPDTSDDLGLPRPSTAVGPCSLDRATVASCSGICKNPRAPASAATSRWRPVPR